MLNSSGMPRIVKSELSVNRRHLQEAKDADRLEPKDTWFVLGLKLSLSWTNDHRLPARQSRKRSLATAAPCLCRAAPPHSLEEEFEGELRLARIARSRHAPEVLAISDVAARVKKLRVVEDVEELGAEFDAPLFVPPHALARVQ